ncbi:MAG: WD40 repeat domain-containing protein, partial [Chloroflexus sp.]|nr:WD40 repeat domain-containing protein [Chloroflexus sp.]
MQQRSSSNGMYGSSADPVSSALEVLWQKLLVAYDGACAISGCQVSAVLRPVLIDPQGPVEPHNALLLRADLQILFQAGLLTIDAMTLEVLVAPELYDSEYGALAGRRLRQPNRLAMRPSRHVLAAHHRLFQLEQPATDPLALQRPLLRQLLAVQSWVNSLAFSPNQQMLATGSWDGTVRLWRLPDGQLQRVISGNIGEINAVAFSPDSQRVA